MLASGVAAHLAVYAGTSDHSLSKISVISKVPSLRNASWWYVRAG